MYKSCNLILHGLCFFGNTIASCCNSPADQIDNQLPPILFDNYNGEVIPPEELFKKIHNYSDMFKNGSCPKSCQNCAFIKEDEWDESDFINEITITNFSNCNADCIYCANNLTSEERSNNYYKIMPILKYYQQNGIIKKGCEFHISGGEFTIYDECDELLKEFGINGYAKIIISSNCIRYSDRIKESIEAGNTYIITSLDCGSRNLFKKIKRIDAFDNVVSNLRQYTQKNKNNITLKYIIIPTVNDNIKEFKNFLSIAESLEIKNLAIEIEGRYTRYVRYNISPYYVHLAEEMKHLAEKKHFQVNFFPFLNQCICNNAVKNMNIIEKISERIQIQNDKIFKTLYSSQKY